MKKIHDWCAEVINSYQHCRTLARVHKFHTKILESSHDVSLYYRTTMHKTPTMSCEACTSALRHCAKALQTHCTISLWVYKVGIASGSPSFLIWISKMPCMHWGSESKSGSMNQPARIQPRNQSRSQPRSKTEWSKTKIQSMIRSMQEPVQDSV